MSRLELTYRTLLCCTAMLLLSALAVACTGPTSSPVPTVTVVAPALPSATPAPTTVGPSATRPTPTTTRPTVAPPTVTPLPPAPTRLPTTAAQAAIWTAWDKSAHAHTYDLGHGPNTYCSRCHSPQNWDPAAKVDAPPNCVTCKFPNDKTLRLARSNQLVSQEDWRNIACDVCHPMQNGVASASLAWFDKPTNTYTPVKDVNALCGKCHTTTEILHHGIDLGKSAHVGFQCTQCHDAHTTKASCDSSGCHAAPKPHAGHDPAHAVVNCAACHDASALRIGPDNTTKRWTTWQVTDAGGQKMTSATVSHNLQKQVDCGRCHFKDNPWNLPLNVSLGK